MKKFLFIFISQLAISQTLSSSLSKQKIDLGEPVQMKINITNLQGKEVIAAQKNGLLPFSFEENKDEIEISENQYIRTIDFSIFEEGKYNIPALEFKVGDEILRTIPYEIEVYNSAKPNEEINDILPNEDVNLRLSDYWEMYKRYFFGLLMIIGLLGFIWVYRMGKKLPKRKVNPAKNSLKNIDLLQNKNYIENGEFRLFYVELLDICREYISTHYHIPADVLLTDDLVDYMKSKRTIPEVPQEKIAVLEEIFTRGDLVKFAKTIPEKSVMQSDLEKVKNMIHKSHSRS